jgi:hypothetical protein
MLITRLIGLSMYGNSHFGCHCEHSCLPRSQRREAICGFHPRTLARQQKLCALSDFAVQISIGCREIALSDKLRGAASGKGLS